MKQILHEGESAMDVRALVTNRFASLTPSEQAVAQYIQENAHEAVLMSLQLVAKRSGTSDATVLRFCRSLGFSGFQDFKSNLVLDLLKQQDEDETPPLTHRLHSGAANLANALTGDITRTLSNLRAESIEAAVQQILSANNIVIIGLAGSGAVAKIFCDTLLSLGIRSSWLSDRVEIERMTALLKANDVLIGISHSGETEEVYRAFERAKSVGATTIGITNFSPSTIEATADIVLLTCVAENILGSYSCIPRIAQLTILELITGNILEAGKTLR
ncbi:MAG: MurR/RpiR family transcriptional regulator [Limnochordia bacterium]